MKIALIADPMIPVPPLLYGGIERIIDMLIKGLEQRGHEVLLYAHRDSKVNVKLYPYPGESARLPKDIWRNTLLISTLLKEKPDVVHSFGRIAYLTPLLWSKVPKIMSYQREPTISRIKWASRLARKNSLVFTGCSEHIAAKISPYATAYAIPNGVPLALYDFKAQVAEDAPLVFLGRIEHIKGTHVAIEVAQKSGRNLIIAGNVPDDSKSQEYFAQQIAPHVDGSHIEYIGTVNDQQKNELLGSAAAFLMPILWDEPFGIVMAEALACGTPVIGLNRGSVPEVVENGKNGFVCNNIAEMVADVTKVDQLSRAHCRMIAEERYSDQAIVDQYEKLYVQLMNN